VQQMAVKDFQKELKNTKLIDAINQLINEHIGNKVSGKIIINFFEGGITSWKTERTFKPKK
jgi:transcriptional regulator CtsR